MNSKHCLSLTFLLFCCFILPPAFAEGNQPQPDTSKVYTQQQLQQDFDAFWQDIHDQYAYLDTTAADWDKVRQVYGRQLSGIQTRGQFSTLLRKALGELSDPHTGVNDGSSSVSSLTRWYSVPSGTDIWAEWHGDKAIITEVRAASGAEKSGLRAGLEVVAVNGVAVSNAVQQRLGQCQRRSDVAARNWALRSVLAGHLDIPRVLELRDGASAPYPVTLEDAGKFLDGLDKRPLLEAKVLPQNTQRNTQIGYIWFNNSLGNNALIPQFDAALAHLRNTKGLILDLRGVPSGGNTTVARAIMSRFIVHDSFYQKHDIPQEERTYGVKRSWKEIVSPRGPFCYTAPVVVLVDHWTGSVGEAVAIGFDGMHRATVVGTRMAGLRGSVEDDVLLNTGIIVSFQVERLFHVNGVPREDFIPPVLVAPSSTTQDVILEAGLKSLRGQKKRNGASARVQKVTK